MRIYIYVIFHVRIYYYIYLYYIYFLRTNVVYKTPLYCLNVFIFLKIYIVEYFTEYFQAHCIINCYPESLNSGSKPPLRHRQRVDPLLSGPTAKGRISNFQNKPDLSGRVTA